MTVSTPTPGSTNQVHDRMAHRLKFETPLDLLQVAV